MELKLPDGWKMGGPDARGLGGDCAKQASDLLADGIVWLVAILVLGLLNAALGFAHLPPSQMEMVESIHLNAVYALILVASASAISRLLMWALERLGHWESGESGHGN